MSCDVVRRCNSDPALQASNCSSNLTPSLVAWELPYPSGLAQKSKKQKAKKKKKERNLTVHMSITEVKFTFQVPICVADGNADGKLHLVGYLKIF